MLDMHKISRQISQDLQSGYYPEVVRINLDSITPDIEQAERPKIINLFDTIAKRKLHPKSSVTEDNSIESLYDYNLVCSDCGNKPIFDGHNNRYICPICDKNKTIFDF